MIDLGDLSETEIVLLYKVIHKNELMYCMIKNKNKLYKSKNRTKQINKKCDLKEIICEKTIEMGIV